MSETGKTICPWCDTEIVWDEELGPEDECPHCHNELNNYRTLNIELEKEEDEGSSAGEREEEEEPEEKGWSNFGWDDGGVLYSDTATLRYQEGVDQVLHSQEEVPECPHCREYMLLAGTETVSGTGFKPAKPEVLAAPLLEPPFDVNVYVCTSCFQVSKLLAAPYREAMMENVRNAKVK
ncbi:hypothetical protein HFN20_17915 [Paenibacillus dendritiformis]|uniref:hypothetical protein n=1 Tax=Paenibacillus dendritiformis TaxID=130049 RepID=UPI00143CDC0E|nr:hypothetical protein [Paenibacillus dendritiformis]NKI23077.1 hypothetical protein [Paenibacillus dendritiformis]NRG00378.1 hypothetical protein [Paenibacillus dendritiformis]